MAAKPINNKSSRKPLNQITNGGAARYSAKRSKIKKTISPEKQQEEAKHHHQQDEENGLDRLLLVHSDLSNLIQQIDELVVKAVKVEGTSKKGKKEIDLFTNLLSDMHSSLKQWIPRFKNVLISPTAELTNVLEQPSPTKSPAADEETRNTDHSPVLSDLESFVSPSPLVSWCPKRTVESGRQLFLLTPLTRSRQLSSKFVSKTTADCPLDKNIEIPSLLTICQDKDADLLVKNDNKDMKPTPNKCSKSSIPEMQGSNHDFLSPPKFKNRCRSMFLMTPRLKMSPPKSCVLLEPIVESHKQENNNIRKKTPFSIRIKTRIATPYNSHLSESLTSKYPEIFEAQKSPCKSSMPRKEVDAPVDPLISSFKSCVVKEPSDKKILVNMATDGNASSKQCILGEQIASMIAAVNTAQGENKSTKPNREVGSTSNTCPESTPMWMEPKSRNGKHPGESTLKKELWAKFEAASSPSNVLRLNVSIFQDSFSKGFLDRLEEICYEEMSSKPESLR